ncbi:DUF624 domain-containing protein [Enterococcus avium]|uniref:DUF624 domain-containing protein n=1 Tax=Enterococcus avium TaxID=33945 RepID=UPI002E0DD8AB
MDTKRFTKFHRLFELVYQLIVLNLLFIIGVLFGGIIFGILPSGYNLVQGIDRINNGEEVRVKDFFKGFKETFFSINTSCFMLLLLIILWIAQFVLLGQFFNKVYFIMTGAMLLLLVAYAINTPVHNKKNNFKRLVGIFLINPKLNFYLLLLSCIILYVNDHISGLWLFLSFSSFQYFFEKAKKTLLRV